MNFDDYMPAKEAAKEIGISYYLLMARIRKGRIAVEKKGWAVFVHKDEVAREKEEQARADAQKE
jgi:hypothetical protein